MTSNVAPFPARPTRPAARRRVHLLAVLLVTVAFVVGGAAVLAAVGSLTWDVTAFAAPADPPAAPVDTGSVTPVDTGGGAGAPDVAPVLPDESGDEAPAEPDTSEDDTAPPDTDTDATDGSEDHGDGADASEDDATGLDDGDAHETSGDAPETSDDAEDASPEEPALSVTQVQEKLRAYGFLIGAADGTAGQQTTAAVMAFQKVNGLAVDGVVGPATTAALLEGSAEPSLRGGPADRIEVDLDAQLLHLIEGGQRTVTLKVSSGNGEAYRGGAARANTPVGDFVVQRRIHGLRQAELGTLYDPLYFHRGFAIHGSPSVPAYPASHGCVRVTIADAAWLIQRIPDGMPVQLYGGTHVFTP